MFLGFSYIFWYTIYLLYRQGDDISFLNYIFRAYLHILDLHCIQLSNAATLFAKIILIHKKLRKWIE